MAQEVIDEQAVEARAAPDLILDVLDVVHGVQLGQVPDPGLLLPVQPRLFVRRRL